MKKIINNILSSKIFWLFVFLLQQVISLAHDCSSPGDCEETAGYNAAVAIVGGAIALVSGIIGSGFSTPPPDTEILVDEEPVQEETQTEPQTQDEEDLSEEDDFIEEQDEEDDFVIEDETENDNSDKIKDNIEEVDNKEEEDIYEEETENIEDNEQEPHKLIHDLIGYGNATRTLIEKIGVEKWKAWVRSKEMAKATKSFYDKIKKLKSKGLTNLVKKYAEKLNHKLQWKAKVNAMGKAKKMGKFMDKLGKLGDALDIFVSIDKVIHTKGDGWDKTGKAAEEILRFGLKKYFGKFPPVAIVDAISSLAGGPNMDKVIDKGLDSYKSGVTKVTEWAYTKPKTDDDKFYDAFRRRKNRINKLKISDAEKKKRMKRVFKILKKNPALWK